MPLPGVTILIKDSSKGTSTDFDGNFKISVNEGQILNISYVGYETQEIKINSASTINIILKESAAQLDEVVVVGYGSQKKASVLGSISQVKGAELIESGSPNLTNALSSIAPGVTIIQSSGQPGAETGEIYIRGNADPLILVDGVEIVGGFANIDPRDVGTISVLKDGAATAVYGIRGANGVIIITTKRGIIGKPQISSTSEFSVKQISFTPDMLNAFESQTALNSALINDQAYGNGYTNEEDLAHYKNGDLPWLYPDTDWQDVMLEDFVTSFNQTLSIRGGNKFVKYYASTGYLQEGNIVNTVQFHNYDPEYKFQKYSFRGNLDFNLTKTTKLNTSISNRLEHTNRPGGSTNPSYAGLYNSAPGGVVPIYPAEVLEQYPDPLYEGLVEPRFGAGANIFAGLNNGGSTIQNKTVFSVDLELIQELDFITEGLSFTGKYNFVSTFTTQRRFSFDTALQARPDVYTLLRDGSWFSFEGRDYERPLEYIEGDESVSGTSEIDYRRAQLNYNRSFGKHNVTGLALFSRGEKVNGTNFPEFNEDYVGRITYDYDAHYFLEAAAAYNGNETFYIGNKFQLFPSVSAGINLAKEKFVVDHIPFINNFKLRYSYGQTGNRSGLRIGTTDNYERWQYLSYFAPQNNRTNARFFFGEDIDDPLSIVTEDQLGNLLLGWETVTKQNLGLDFGFFNNKISGSLDFFTDNRTDIIGRNTASVPLYFGSDVALPFQNLSETKSHGMDLSVTYRDRTEEGFSYSVTGIYGFYENRSVTSHLDGPGAPSYTTVAGKSLGTTALLQTDGYFQNIDELVNYPVYVGAGLGDYRYIDYNANGTVIGDEQEDQIKFDLPKAPKHTYSVRLNLSYKAWSMSALVNGVEGHKGLVAETYTYALPSGNATGRVDQLDYWTPTNTDAAYPALHALNNPNLTVPHSSRIVSLDYIKLRSMNIGYSFDMSKNSRISKMKLYLSGNNLLTFSDLKYGDPEGNSPGSHPILRRFNLGLNLNF